MKWNIRNKKPLLAGTAVVLTAAIAAGIWFGTQGGAEPVGVYPFTSIGMTEYWGDSKESYGPVTTDKIQTVFLSDTQTVTEILVSEGDEVKKGDLLMTFDTTLSELALERKRLAVEKLKLELQDAQNYLREINSMKPMEMPSYDDVPGDTGEEMGTELTQAYQVSNNPEYDGSTPEKALICWMRDSTAIDSTLLEVLRQQAQLLQEANLPTEPTDPTIETTVETIPETTGETVPETTVETIPETTGETVPETTAATVPVTTVETVPETTIQTVPETTIQTTPTTVETVSETTVQTQPVVESVPETVVQSVPETAAQMEPADVEQAPASNASAMPEEGQPETTPVQVTSYYVVFKVTEGNMSLGQRTVWQGIHVSRGNSLRFFDATFLPDYTLMDLGEEDPGMNIPDFDFGSGFTAAQIAQMRSEQQKKIKDLEFQVKMADADYKIMQTEVNDGNVYAEIDGKVISVLTEKEAKDTKSPLLKVSGGGGFYIQGSINELEKDSLQIGQEVTISDWETGMTYTGTVQSIGDFPSSQNSWNGMENPNSSYYPFTAFVDGSADHQAGRYVNMTYSTGTGENGIYLQNPFVRTEKGRSYVFVQGKNGRLEKRYVTVGKSLWGSYTEIRSGLEETDLIAFPYGKNVKEGAATVEGDLNTLYGY